MKILRTGAALVAIAALTLTACGGGSGDTTDATGSQLSGTLQGVGASSMRAAQEVWRARFQTANPNVTINYSPDGSGAGRTAFMDGSADFAGSDRALKDEEMTMTFAKCVWAPLRSTCRSTSPPSPSSSTSTVSRHST